MRNFFFPVVFLFSFGGAGGIYFVEGISQQIYSKNWTAFSNIHVFNCLFNTEDFLRFCKPKPDLEPAILRLLEIGLRRFRNYSHTLETEVTYQNPKYNIVLDYVFLNYLKVDLYLTFNKKKNQDISFVHMYSHPMSFPRLFLSSPEARGEKREKKKTPVV